MEILLISGFLGAGKTRFIKEMVRATGRQFVVVENEFGNVNLDGQTLRRDLALSSADQSPEMRVWELTEGCICCSMNMDFSLSILTIANSLNPDYLLVEPSGVALPSRILDGLGKISYEGIGILSPVTIVDAAHFRDQRRDYGEYFEDQLRTAGTVVLSKSERLSEADFEEVGRELSLAPGVRFPHVHYSRWPHEMWRELFSRRAPQSGGGTVPPEIAPAPLETLTLRGMSFPSPASLIPRLEMLISGVFGRVVRAKGFAPKVHDGEWVGFNVVDGVYEIVSSSPMEEGEIVIIGENLELEGLNKLFGGTRVEED